jgi:hypothetical protein
LPIRNTARWKCERSTAVSTSCAGGSHHTAHLALPHDRAGIDGVADLAIDWQGFASERRLVDAKVVAVAQFEVGRHDIAELDQHDVARHQQARGQIPPLAVAQHAGHGCQPFPERGDRRVRFVFLEKADARVDQQHDDDNREVVPTPRHSRQHGRNLDHPRNRSPEIAEKFAPGANAFLADRVLTVLRETAARLVAGEAGEVGSRRGVAVVYLAKLLSIHETNLCFECGDFQPRART